MAIYSTITMDTAGLTATCIIKQNATILETIVYNASNKQLTFPTRSPVTLTTAEFRQKLHIFISFQNFILSQIFNVIVLPAAGASNNTTTLTDDNISQLNFTFQPGNHPLFNYTCNYPNGNVVLGNRNQALTLNIADWTYCFNELKQFTTIFNSRQ